MLQMFVYILEWVPGFGEYKNDENHYDFFSSFHIDSFRETQTCTVRSTHLTPLTKSPIAKNWHIFIYASIRSLLLGWYAFALSLSKWQVTICS